MRVERKVALCRSGGVKQKVCGVDGDEEVNKKLVDAMVRVEMFPLGPFEDGSNDEELCNIQPECRSDECGGDVPVKKVWGVHGGYDAAVECEQPAQRDGDELFVRFFLPVVYAHDCV